VPGLHFRIEGRFRQPEPWWLLWLNPLGKLQSPVSPGKPQRDIGYPLDGSTTSIDARGPAGTHVLLLMTESDAGTDDAKQQLVTAFKGIGPAPPVGLTFWWPSNGKGTLRGSGDKDATTQEYVANLNHLVPPGLTLRAVVFVPSDSSEKPPAMDNGANLRR
jgi:hypothetical protein